MVPSYIRENVHCSGGWRVYDQGEGIGFIQFVAIDERSRTTYKFLELLYFTGFKPLIM